MDRHGQLAQQLVGERRVVEFEVSLVVELEQRGRVGVLLLEVHVVLLRLRRGVAALLAHVHLQETRRYVSKMLPIYIDGCSDKNLLDKIF